MSCRCRWIDSASVRGLIAHGYSLIDRKPAVGVGATWRFAGTPPNLAASTHARASTEVRNRPARLPEEDKGDALRSLLIESDFPVAVTMLKASGVSDFIAREIVGHDSAEVSRQYSHLSTEHKRSAMRNLPDVTTNE